MLQHALKEWAALCLALAHGQQTLLLRKGGIRETTAGFAPEQQRFWLLPTYLHQSRTGLARAAWALLDRVESLKPPAGELALQCFAEIAESFHLNTLEQVERLEPYHFLSPATTAQRFTYRQPGLWAMVLRVHALPRPHFLPNAAAYDGCKSWVTLEKALATDGAIPILPDAAFAEQQARIRNALVGGGDS